MERITPEYISQLVNFYSQPEQPGWSYNANASDMRVLQARGSAKIFNLLCENRIALLADEVGMGKTIQSLAVCAAIWNQKPDARILVFAPREVVALNWLNEYDNFIRTHYRTGDDVVKSASGNDPVKYSFFCRNLYAMADGVLQGWPRFFVAKTTSLSTLMAGDLAEERFQKLGVKKGVKTSEKAAQCIKKIILDASRPGKPYFDLLIIDEAHYFRHVNNGSLRQQTAKILFGDPEKQGDSKLARNVLLLTATPNHGSSDDIGNIIRQFNPELAKLAHNDLLEKICVRRLRKLGNPEDAKNKYNYREEKESESDFASDPLSEMFFGLYQHSLVKKLSSADGHNASGPGVNQIMKYLEGVEFIPAESKNKGESVDEEASKTGNDISKGSDADLLYELSKNFRKIFGHQPSHPKYLKVVKDLEYCRDKEKTLVFVRRIASVSQIARQVLEHYDRHLWATLPARVTREIPFEDLSRRRFKEHISSEQIPEEDEEETLHPENDQEGRIPESKVLDLFKTKKSGSVHSTSASNFRNSFASSRPGVMAIFFSPGLDYREKPYTNMKLRRYQFRNDVKASYFNSALMMRVSPYVKENGGGAVDILSILLPKTEEQGSTEISTELHTLFTVFWERLRNDSMQDEAHKEKIISTYESFSIHEKEAFSKFIQKGALLASAAVVDFFSLYIGIQEGGLEQYSQFIQKVREGFTSMRLYHQIQESILLFRTLYRKEFGITSPEKLVEEEWDYFDNAQPVYPYSRGNSNQKILKSFNTPFYPDVLIATSVLQEGVNLQYFCDSVYHYGMAWTPGDNEQRIGRVDRMFGKTDRRLQAGEKARLEITYPYLKSTIDEEQLRRFMKRKFHEENLIDQGFASEDSERVHFDDSDNTDWKNYLRKPTDREILDPFPAEHSAFSAIRETPGLPQEKDLSGFFDSIAHAISGLKELSPKSWLIQMDGYNKLLVDPKMESGRRQPVVIEMLLDRIGSGINPKGKAVYCLRMRTPICPLTEVGELQDAFNKKNRVISEAYTYGLKLGMNSALTAGSFWACYLSVELPFFISDPEINHLNQLEITTAFRRLVHCADLIEQQVFGRDLTINQLRIQAGGKEAGSLAKPFRTQSRTRKSSWESEGGYYFLRQNFRRDFAGLDNFKKAMILNGRHLYVKTALFEKTWMHEVSYLQKDAQPDELELMKKHLDVFMKRVDWD